VYILNQFCSDLSYLQRHDIYNCVFSNILNLDNTIDQVNASSYTQKNNWFEKKLRGCDARMCCFRLTSSWHSKLYAQENTLSSFNLRIRMNWPLKVRLFRQPMGLTSWAYYYILIFKRVVITLKCTNNLQF